MAEFEVCELEGMRWVQIRLRDETIRAEAGKSLDFTGTLAPNAGELNLLGGTLDFTAAVTNSAGGRINGRGTLDFGGGLTNAGKMQFTGGATDIYGSVNFTGGEMINSGGANIVTFYGNVTHNGDEIRTSPTNTTVFFGNLTGAGPFTGTGAVRFEGTFMPGNSPAVVPVEGDLQFGTDSRLVMELGGKIAVVKSQIHAGGRGKGTIKGNAQQRGVQLVKSADEAKKVAEAILGKTLVTIQTGEEGKTVNQVLIEEGCDIKRELYLSLLMDRAISRVTIVASTEGGMDIEKVVHEQPEKIIKVAIDPVAGYQPFHGRRIAFALGLEGIEISDKATQRDGAACYGAIGVGGTKMKIHKAALRRLFESNDAQLDAETIYELGKTI